MTGQTGVVPFYFGKQDGELFGCLHEPAQLNVRRYAFLICQPMGHEYINCHRALRQLAVRLAEAGFPVLRFDYYGCGDSAGDVKQGSLTRWLDDISTAAAELRSRAGVSQLGVIGLRLGGSLAACAASRYKDFESLVLWDPVSNGKDYLEELLALQKEMLRFRPKPRRLSRFDTHLEVLGYPISRLLRAQLEELDLHRIAGRPATQILIVNHAHENDPALRKHLLAIRAQVDQRTLEAPQIWLPTPDGSLLVPAQILQSIVSWACAISL